MALPPLLGLTQADKVKEHLLAQPGGKDPFLLLTVIISAQLQLTLLFFLRFYVFI